jgi:hypothetical protein
VILHGSKFCVSKGKTLFFLLPFEPTKYFFAVKSVESIANSTFVAKFAPVLSV